MTLEHLSGLCILGVVGLQAALFSGLAILKLLGHPPSERGIGRAVRGVYGLAFGLALLASLAFVGSGRPRIVLPLGDWILTAEYDFHFVLQLDSLSVPFLLLATTLCGVISVFSVRYMHREPGYTRYFLFLSLFGLGDALTVLAGSIEVLYCSWELIGLASTLLISFYQEREGPARNSLYTFVVYRISDLALLLAAVTVYNLFYNGDFSTFLGIGAWPHSKTNFSHAGATVVGLFFVVAAIGKAAQIPFSGWLPRAMEGPTPSTAIFYGALSVHAGAYLMLRVSPLLDAAPSLAFLVFAVGLSTALMATFVGRVQTDIKCSLAYAALAQVGLIFAEIGLGLRILPVIHTLGHALLRTVQFLRAPSLLHEIHELDSALGGFPVHNPDSPTVSSWRLWLYQAALQRCFLENLLERWFVLPFQVFCRALQRLDESILEWIAGKP